eukprot:292238-Chlamydomonas_euryale.AAC.6
MSDGCGTSAGGPHPQGHAPRGTRSYPLAPATSLRGWRHSSFTARLSQHSRCHSASRAAARSLAARRSSPRDASRAARTH